MLASILTFNLFHRIASAPLFLLEKMSANSENDYKQEFWYEIERDIGGQIPEIVKKVLSKCGYEIRFCLENLATTDIDEIENHAKTHLKDKLKRWLKNDSEYQHSNISEFAFLPGHRKIIALFPKKLSAANASESVPKDNEPIASTSSRSIPTNERGENVLIPTVHEAELKMDLCKRIRRWMIGKDFHESVSKSIIWYMYMAYFMYGRLKTLKVFAKCLLTY